MPRFLDGPNLNQRMRDALERTSKVRLAVAFWGDGASDAIGLKAGNDVRIVCNLTSGGTNPSEIRKLINRGFDVRHFRGLHAKLGTINKMSFVGSSNMSANGLGLKNAIQGWAEFNIVYASLREEIVEQFDTFWAGSMVIDDALLERAELSWKVSKSAEAQVELLSLDGPTNILDILKKNPEAFDDLPTIVTLYRANESPELRKANKVVRKDRGQEWECYEDWEDLPADCYIFDFAEEDGGIEWVSLFRRHLDVPGPRGFQAVKRINSIAGHGIGKGNGKKLLSGMKRLIKEKNLPERGEDNAVYFPVSILARAMNEAG